MLRSLTWSPGQGVQWNQKSTSNQVNTALDDESEDEDSMGLEKATKIVCATYTWDIT